MPLRRTVRYGNVRTHTVVYQYLSNGIVHMSTVPQYKYTRSLLYWKERYFTGVCAVPCVPQSWWGGCADTLQVHCTRLYYKYSTLKSTRTVDYSTVHTGIIV